MVLQYNSNWCYCGRMKCALRNRNASTQSSCVISSVLGIKNSHSALNLAFRKSSSISRTPEWVATSSSCSSETIQPTNNHTYLLCTSAYFAQVQNNPYEQWIMSSVLHAIMPMLQFFPERFVTLGIFNFILCRSTQCWNFHQLIKSWTQSLTTFFKTIFARKIVDMVWDTTRQHIVFL